MSAGDFESAQETAFWLQQPGIRDDLADGDREYDDGETLSVDELRARHGLPPLSSQSAMVSDTSPKSATTRSVPPSAST